MNKQDIVFGTKWFQKHQRKLLWLLNTPLIKYWFRYVLRINNDLKSDEIICEINPNNYKVYLGRFLDKGKFIYKIRADFRTHDKFSKRLYYAFKPIWFLMHGMDWAFLDRMEALSKLSFGFSTLTQYPFTISTTNPAVGLAGQATDNSTWATIRDGAGNDSANRAHGTNNNDSIMFMCGTNASTYYYLIRGFVNFDTSSLTAGATISAAILSLYGVSKSDDNSYAPTTNIYLATPANTSAIVNADYTQIGTTAQCDTAITYAGWDIAGYNAFTFNATGLGNISKTGISSFGIRNVNYDVNNSQPAYVTGNGGYAIGFKTSYTDQTLEPKLVVTYTVPAVATAGFLFLMV